MKSRKVPIFKLEFDKEFRAKFYEGCEQIFNEAFLANHTFVRRFEAEFAKAAGAKHALGVCNGTVAIEIPLRALNVKGKEVILQTNTFIATAVAIENAGAIPVPVDIDGEHYGMSPERLKKAISNKTAAVVIVHIGGLITPRIKEIQKICKDHNLPLIEDCAQAFGSEFDGVKVGNFGIAGCFSFQTTKSMTTGEGGAAIANDDKFYDLLRSTRQYGMNLQNSILHERSGANFKMSEFVALMGLCELDRVKSRIEKRKMLAARYQKNLSGSGWKALAPGGAGQTGYYKQIVLPPVEREKVAEHLKKRDISLTGGVYYVPVHRQPVYAGRFKDGDFPNANYYAERHICPPCYPELDAEDIDYVTEALLELHK